MRTRTRVPGGVRKGERYLVVAAIGLLTGPLAVLLWGAGRGVHVPAAQYGARRAPEPFRSNWAACIGAMVPDEMRDQPLGHENHRAAGLLCTREAIRYLRRGETRKALLVASIRTHYLQDSIAIAHADVWKPRRKDDRLQPGVSGRNIWSFLPASVQDYWLPFGERKPQQGYSPSYEPLRIDDPPLQKKAWAMAAEENLTRNMHAFFDRTEFHEGWPLHGFPLSPAIDSNSWSAYDFEVYARWRSEQIALEVLDRDSVLGQNGAGWIKFAAARQMQRALDHEMENMIAAVSAYYRYLTVASRTEVSGWVGTLPRGADGLLALAKCEPTIHLAANASWPLRRACSLLAMEIVRARFRGNGDAGTGYASKLRSEIDLMLRLTDPAADDADRRIVVSWGAPAGARPAAGRNRHTGNTIAADTTLAPQGQVTLQGENLQSTIHLVDYLLDLCYAPLLGRTPMHIIFEAFVREWDGVGLLARIEEAAAPELPALIEGITNRHAADYAAWTKKVHDLVRPRTAGSDANLTGVIPRFYQFLILDLPLPDGTVVNLSKR